MTIAQMSNILVIILCSAVLVQSVRLMRAFRAMKRGALTDTVGALDRATREARQVLGELKDRLEECSDHAAALARGRTLLDELDVNRARLHEWRPRRVARAHQCRTRSRGTRYARPASCRESRRHPLRYR